MQLHMMPTSISTTLVQIHQFSLIGNHLLIWGGKLTDVRRYPMAEFQVWSPALYFFVRYTKDDRLARQALTLAISSVHLAQICKM